MPENTPGHAIPYPSPSDPIRGSTGDYILTDLRDLALGADSAITTAVDTRAPLSHTHSQSDVSGLSGALDAAASTADWGGVSGRPSAFPPAAHSHPVSDVTGLADRLAALEYDSGTRLITQHATGIVSGDFYLRVWRGWAMLGIDAVVTSNADPRPFPSGGALAPYAPTSSKLGQGTVNAGRSGTTYSALVAANGTLALYSAPADTPLYGAIVWPCDRTPPTTPIGTPA